MFYFMSVHIEVTLDFLYLKKRWFSISHCCFLEEAITCKNEKDFRIRQRNVKRPLGINGLRTEQAETGKLGL